MWLFSGLPTAPVGSLMPAASLWWAVVLHAVLQQVRLLQTVRGSAAMRQSGTACEMLNAVQQGAAAPAALHDAAGVGLRFIPHSWTCQESVNRHTATWLYQVLGLLPVLVLPAASFPSGPLLGLAADRVAGAPAAASSLPGCHPNPKALDAYRFADTPAAASASLSFPEL